MLISDLQTEDGKCHLCDKQPETLHHLLFGCQASKVLWWNSPSNIKITTFHNLTVNHWITLMIGPSNPHPLGDVEKDWLIHFLAVAVERLWMAWNQGWSGSKITSWSALSDSINKTYCYYWNASQTQNRLKRSNGMPVVPRTRTPPIPGGLKINFDAAFKDGITFTGVILRNDYGFLLGLGWIALSLKTHFAPRLKRHSKLYISPLNLSWCFPCYHGFEWYGWIWRLASCHTYYFW